MLDRIVVHERSRGRRAATPAAPGSGRLAFCFASQWVAFNFARSVLAGYCRILADHRQSPARKLPVNQQPLGGRWFSRSDLLSRCDSRLGRRRRPAASSPTGHGSARDTQDPRWRPPQPWRSWPSPGKTCGRAGRAPSGGRAPGQTHWIRGFTASERTGSRVSWRSAGPGAHEPWCWWCPRGLNPVFSNVPPGRASRTLGRTERPR